MKQTTRRNRQRRNTTRRQRQRRNTTRRQRQRKNNKRVKKGGSGGGGGGEGGGGGGGEGGGEGGAPPIDNFRFLKNIIMNPSIKDKQYKATLITEWGDNELINKDQQQKLIALLNQKRVSL